MASSEVLHPKAVAVITGAAYVLFPLNFWPCGTERGTHKHPLKQLKTDAFNDRSGIGLAAALRYAKEGASIVLVDIDPAALDPAVEKVKSIEGVGTVFGVRVDVGNVKEVAGLRDRVLEEFGEVSWIMSHFQTFNWLPQNQRKCGMTDITMIGPHPYGQRWYFYADTQFLFVHALGGVAVGLEQSTQYELLRCFEHRSSFRSFYGEARKFKCYHYHWQQTGHYLPSVSAIQGENEDELKL